MTNRACLPLFFVLLVLALPGCGGDDPADTEPAAFTPTHVVQTESVYYLTGPQQGRPPDGTFPVGTRVERVQGGGSYTLVENAAGLVVWTATGALKPL